MLRPASGGFTQGTCRRVERSSVMVVGVVIGVSPAFRFCPTMSARLWRVHALALSSAPGRTATGAAMRRWGILAASVLAASTAWADTRTLAQSGIWEAFGGTTDSGRGVCGISAEPNGRYFGLKLYAGNDTFTIQLGTNEWKFADGEK